jgi:hypothetical protein
MLIRPMPTRPSHGDWFCTLGGLLLQPGLIRQIMQYISQRHTKNHKTTIRRPPSLPDIARASQGGVHIELQAWEA